MKLKLLLLMLVVAASVYADNESCLIIKQKSGNETVIEFSTNPIITFEGEDMVVTNEFTTIYLPLDDIDEYLVNNGTSGIKDIPSVPQFARGHVVFSGLSKDTPVYVYTLDGKAISKQHADDVGNADVNLELLPKGVFIISTNNNKIKVINNQ